jgi:hypothetical protein
VIRHGLARIGCEGCAHEALEVTDEYAVLESSREAEVLAWRCGECGDGGESIMSLVAADLDPAA